MTLTATRLPALPQRRDNVIRRHPLISFFVLANLLSWSAWTPYIVSQNGLGLWGYRYPAGGAGRRGRGTAAAVAGRQRGRLQRDRDPDPRCRAPGRLAELVARLGPSLLVATAALVGGGFANGIAGGRTGAGPALAAAALQAVTVIGGPLLLAGVVRGRRLALESGRRELQALAREHDALVQAAVADERTAMARELHDIAAHHLSGIALMAAAIERQIDTDPETAKHSVRQVRTQSTAVLDDLRRLVGMMRDDDEAPRSVASLDAVPDLVDRQRAGGAPVELRTLRAPAGRRLGEGVGTLAQLGVYRIAQESLTNAAKHAPGALTVVEIDDRRDGLLLLCVTNGPGGPGPLSAGGFGLVGMRERADLLGATLRCGAQPGGGWQVQVEVPRDPTGRSGPRTVRSTGGRP